MADEPSDFLKELGDVPPPPILKRNRMGITLQFFLVPSMIVGLCIGIFLLFRFMTEDTEPLSNLFDRMVSASGHTKQVYAADFARRLRQERGDFTKEAPPELTRFVPRILEVLKSMSGPKLSDSDIFTKQICLQSLANIGAPEAAPEIAKIIEDEKNEVIQWEGLEALGALKNSEVKDTIRKFCESPSSTTRKYAVYNLGALRQPETIPDLQKRLTDPSVEVQWNAAFALAYFLNDRSGVPVLLDMLNREKVALAVDAKEEYRDQFISKAMQSAAMALAAIKEKSALGPLKKAAESDGDSDVRSACRNAVKAIEP